MINRPLYPLLTALCSLTATGCLADASYDLDALVRGHYDRSQLHAHGYDWAAQIGDGRHRAEFWFNAERYNCAKILIHNGVIDSISNAGMRKCLSRPRAQPLAAGMPVHRTNFVDRTLMSHFCCAKAASRFHVSPRDILTLPTEKQSHHYVVYGQWEQNDIHTFTCTFSQRGQLTSLTRTS